MSRRLLALPALVVLAIACLAAPAAAQNAVTITGHVSAARTPLQGASVRIEQLDLGATTNADGRYSIIVPSSRVQGQTVTLTARYLRYRAESVQIILVGGSLVQDFELVPATDAPPPARAERPRATDTSRTIAPPSRVATTTSRIAGAAPVIRLPSALPGLTIDSSAFLEIAGPTDLPSALAGRLAGVEVQSSSAVGGTSALQVRGPHTISGLTQPLYVVDGILVDNSSVSTLSQRMGLGGYDYGSAISDLNLEDIASVKLLRGPAAAMLYGGRAANGVIIVTTRNAHGLSGFDISASQQVSFEKALRLPEYQNLYGQGLGGAFAFFNGKGGGVNDSVSQSWGPAFVGQPLPQASITEAARADVRPWIARPNNVSDYFDRGRTFATNVAAQGASETGQFRLSVANRSTNGLTPQSSLSRQSATFTGGLQPSARLDLSGNLQLYRDKAEDRPGSGFDESNPVSVFSMMGRQVDVLALRNHLRDANGNQISWNYTTHNNPYFAALANDEHDDRSRWLGGGTATYAFNGWLQGTARAGTDHYSDIRRFDVAKGWMGGFPYYAGRGDFSTGGLERDDISATQTNIEALLRATPAASGSGAFAFTLGAGRRSNSLQVKSTGSDKLPDAGTTAPQDLNGDSRTLFVTGGVQGTLRDYATLDVSARHESSSLGSASGAELYPAVLASIDLTRANPSLRHGNTVDALVLRGGWSRSGNDATPALLFSAMQAVPAALIDQLAAPEITSGFELGGNASMFDRRLSLDLSYYNERSENLLVPAITAFARTGTITNNGIEAQIGLVPLRYGENLEWRVGFNFARNTNLLESLGGSVAGVPLTAPIGGVTVEAREGSALGAIVGTGYLRDASGELLLRNGHPLPDSITGPRVLATSAANWTGGISSGVRVWGIDLSVLFDVRRGGKIFSASNRAGAYAGNLTETSFRPDTGLLISGLDVATAKANAVHVTTEDYYHALGAIGERWLYDASFVKLREARATIDLPLHALGLHAQRARVSVVGRNLAIWTDAPNIDPESVLNNAVFRGAELGQLPTTRSVGVQFTLTP